MKAFIPSRKYTWSGDTLRDVMSFVTWWIILVEQQYIMDNEEWTSSAKIGRTAQFGDPKGKENKTDQ